MSTEITPTSPTIPDNWESRIQQFAKTIGRTPQEVENILNTPPYSVTKEPMGIELLSDEEALPFGDLRKLFCEQKNGISLPILRIAMKYLRGPKDSTKANSIDPDLLDLQNKYGIKTRIEDLDIEQLIGYYNPRRKNIIHDALSKKYCKYGKFIAFKPDSEIVDTEATINYVYDLEAGYNQEESIEVDGELVHLYEIGQVPFEMVKEDPFAPGIPLKRERSTENRINWNSISDEIRQFWRIAWENGEVSISNPQERAVVSQLILKPLQELKEMFPESYLKFKTMKKTGKLPNLQLSTLDVKTSQTKKNNPFSIRSNRSY